VQAERDNDFHTLLAQRAQYVYLLARHFPAQAQALDGETVRALIEPVFRGDYNTLSAAYGILALAAYGSQVLPDPAAEQIRFAAQRDGVMQPLTTAHRPFPGADYPVSAQALTIEAAQALFYLNIETGFDRTLPTEAVREGIEIHRDFLDREGNVVHQATQGDVLTVRLKVRALEPRWLSNIAVVDLLPGGFEVLTDSVRGDGSGWQADYIDVREDRVVYYGSFDGRVRELRYQVKLVASGDFVVPASHASSMYDRSIRALAPAGRFRVAGH
jgi:uncharacterized protein YfaS (alpha-2-macroglobulin family)